MGYIHTDNYNGIFPKYSSNICLMNLIFDFFIIPGVSINLIPINSNGIVLLIEIKINKEGGKTSG